MANVKISQLASATSLAGTEVLPVVQSGTTKKVTVQAIADLAGGAEPQTIDIASDGTVVDYNSTVSFRKQATILTNVSGNQSIQIDSFPEIYLSRGTSTTISFPSLTFASISISQFANLTTISFPVLTKVGQAMGSISINVNSLLTTINFPVLTSFPSSSYVNLTDNALSEATVDHILAKLAATTAINGTLNIYGGTNAVPSAAGLASKNILVGRGWTVNHNFVM